MAMIEESQENTNEDSEDSVPTNGAADGKQESESEEKVKRIKSFKNEFS